MAVQAYHTVSKHKKQALYRYGYVDPKTRHFVVSGTPGAVKVRIAIPQTTPKKRKAHRLANGRFATVNAAKRSQAAKRAARTRKLRRQGINRIDTWQTPSGSQGFESYELLALDPKLVKDIIDHVAASIKGSRFLFTGGIDFLDADENEFTNFTHYFADDDKKAPTKLIKQLQQLLIDPSDPRQAGKSATHDLVRTYIVFRFAR